VIFKRKGGFLGYGGTNLEVLLAIDEALISTTIIVFVALPTSSIFLA